jgi:putative transposase
VVSVTSLWADGHVYYPLETEPYTPESYFAKGRNDPDFRYVSVHGKWCSLYRAIDREGNLVDSMVSEKRDLAAAKRFFQQAVDVVGHAPERVTTDGHDSYPRAIRETLGSDVIHRCNRYRGHQL